MLQLQEGAQFPYPNDLFLDGIVQSETTVNVTRNEEGYVYNLPPWAEMESIIDTEVFFKHSNISAKFSYFQFYGWAPW